MAATPVANSVPRTGNSFIDGLTQGSSWSLSGDRTLTYSFWNGDPIDGDLWFWTEEGKALARFALQQWANVANVRFQEVAPTGSFYNNPSELSIAFSDNLTFFDLAGLAAFPDPPIMDFLLASEGISPASWPTVEGDVLLNPLFVTLGNSFPGGWGFLVGLHEIGHALGLKHPHDHGYRDHPTFEELGIQWAGNTDWTVMSGNEIFPASSVGHPITPMPLDILAIQHIYGPNWSYHTGNDVYVLGDFPYSQTIWDAGGIDTFNASGLAFPVSINLNEFGFSLHGSVAATAIAGGTTIENAIGGSAGDLIVGNPALNVIRALSGDDTIRGAAGSDIIYGNQNADAIYGNQDGDALYGGQGSDTLFGGQHEDLIYGNFQDDIVYGNFANDTLFGGQDDDVLYGGQDNDMIFGNLGNDILHGNKGNDTLVGGPGADTLIGGAGADTFVTDEFDVVVDLEPWDIIVPESEWLVA